MVAKYTRAWLIAGPTGWQIQKSRVTVQQKVEDALSKCTRFSRDELKLVGAGRTDAGVHALGQVRL